MDLQCIATIRANKTKIQSNIYFGGDDEEESGN